MSSYRPGQDPLYDYGHPPAHPDDPQEERSFVSNVQNIHHGLPHGQPLHQQLQQPHQHHPQQIYDHHNMAHQQPQYVPAPPGLMYVPQSQMVQPSGGMGQSSGSMRQPPGTKRPRSDDMGDMGMSGHMRPDDMMTHMPPQSMVRMPSGYGDQGPQSGFHNHSLPGGGPSKRQRTDELESMAGPGGGAPSVLGMEGMPDPAPRPRGPKLKFTPEDDLLLVDLKENKSLTWKQIAEFFPGRSSGTLQVRYCTKLKAKTTQWTDETIQKLQTALHDYEQEKWRIVSQKVGTGFTAAACKEKAAEL